MWPYPCTIVGTPSHPGQLDRVAATLPSQAPAGAAQVAPELRQWEGQDVPSVRSSSCIFQGGILRSGRYVPTYLDFIKVKQNIWNAGGSKEQAGAAHQ